MAVERTSVVLVLAWYSSAECYAMQWHNFRGGSSVLYVVPFFLSFCFAFGLLLLLLVCAEQYRASPSPTSEAATMLSFGEAVGCRPRAGLFPFSLYTYVGTG